MGDIFSNKKMKIDWEHHEVCFHSPKLKNPFHHNPIFVSLLYIAAKGNKVYSKSFILVPYAQNINMFICYSILCEHILYYFFLYMCCRCLQRQCISVQQQSLLILFYTFWHKLLE